MCWCGQRVQTYAYPWSAARDGLHCCDVCDDEVVFKVSGSDVVERGVLERVPAFEKHLCAAFESAVQAQHQDIAVVVTGDDHAVLPAWKTVLNTTLHSGCTAPVDAQAEEASLSKPAVPHGGWAASHERPLCSVAPQHTGAGVGGVDADLAQQHGAGPVVALEQVLPRAAGGGSSAGT